MSASFRPVLEIWGEHSSMFLDHDDMLEFLDELALRIDDCASANEYGEVTSVFFVDGEKLLDYVEKNPEFTVDSFSESLAWESAPNMHWQALLDEKREHLKSLMSNFKTYAPEWRKSINKSGALTFYVD